MAKKRRVATPAQPARPGRYTVFISHATDDKFIAKALCERIEELGVTTFRDDRDITGGDDIPEAIIDSIRDCREFVVLLTPKSITREWVLVEIGMALALRHRVVPLFYHVAPDEMPGTIRNKRGFHVNDLDAYLADLRQRVLGS
jgi:hypothetical protein